MRTGKTQFWVFTLVCITLSIVLNLNNALGATINVPTVDYPTIQAGIDAAVDGDTVLVADGTYTGAGNKNLDFNGKAITVISENGPNNTIIDCENDGRGFLFNSDENENSILSGFTITNGNATGGGGIYCYRSSPTITDCIIRGNKTDSIGGGGIHCRYSSPSITKCIIRENSSAGPGGGILSSGGTTIITNCVINGNTAETIGGGIHITGSSSSKITNCTISGNSALNGGGGISVGWGASPIITNCILWANTISEIYHDDNTNAVITYCDVQGGHGGEGNLNRDPLFIDPANGDYHLLAISPCVDAGTSSGAPGTDIDGDSRPIDGNADDNAEFDIGADEAGVPLNHDIAVQTMLPQPVPVKFGTNFTPEARVLNLGSQDENDFEVICEIRQNSTIIYSDTKSIPQLDSLNSIDVVFTGWTPEDEGEYELKIYTQLAGDENPDNDTEIRTVKVITFSAEFTSDVTQGLVPLEVKFNDLSTGGPTEWLWDFGDGNQSNEQNPTHTYNSQGTYTVSLTISNGTLSDSETKINYIRVLREAPNIFGIELGNSWTYQGTYPGGSYTSEAEVISIDQTTFPTTTHVIEHTMDGNIVGKNWYETNSSELKLWGEDFGDFIGFANGLLLAWYPMQVSDHKVSSATVSIEGLVFNVSMTVDVLTKESVDLGFDTLEAYKLSYRLRVWGHGADISDTSYRWVVPYLGFVKYEDDGQTEALTDFAIGGGTITPTTDADGDGLKDYEELIIYETNWQESDTDSDGLTDYDEVNTYGTDPNKKDSDNDGLDDGDEINTHDTDPTNEDTDNDGLTDGDEINTYSTDPNNEDTDSDGLTDGDEVNTHGTEPDDPDTDGDGLTDGDEVNTYGTNPNNEDTDGDGVSDKDEIDGGRNPNNREPDKTELYLPPDGQPDVSLTAELETGDFSDDDGDVHALTQWQISTAPFPVDSEPEPEDLVFDFTSDTQLTLLDVPPLILDANNTEYFWRARFTDSGNATSEYAVPFSFTTVDDSPEDNNPEDGIPDGQEADCLAIFDPDAVPQDTVCFNTVVGNAQIGMQGSTNVASIEACGSVDPATIPEDLQGVELAMGLISFKAKCNQPGDIIEIIYYSSEPIAAGAKWYKYDPINGLQDYSAHTVISADRKSIIVEYQDGGFGDLDGVANGVIIDPSGPGVAVGGGGGGGGGSAGCFISTIASGFGRSSEIPASVLLFSALFVGLSSFRKKLGK